MHLVQLEKVVFLSPCGLLGDCAHAVGTSEDQLLFCLNRHLPQRLIKGPGGLFVEVKTMEGLPCRLEVLCCSDMLVVGGAVLLAVVPLLLSVHWLLEQLG